LKQSLASDFSVLLIGTSAPFAVYPLKAIAQVYPLAGIVESARRDFDSHAPLQRLNLKFAQWLGPHSLWRLAKQLHVPYYFYNKADNDSFLNFLKSVHPDIGVIASMNHLLPAQSLSIPRCGFINMHPSLLPDLRGPHVWTWLYYFNDREGGATISRVNAGEDSGDVLQQESFPIFSGMTSQHLVNTSIHIGTRLLLQSLEDIRQGKSKNIPQPARPLLRRARSLVKGENLFHYRSWDLEHTYHFLQGVSPWYSPFKLKLGSVEIMDWVATGFSPSPLKGHRVGTIAIDWRGFYFTHAQGKIRLKLKIRLYYFLLFLLLDFALVNIFLAHWELP